MLASLPLLEANAGECRQTRVKSQKFEVTTPIPTGPFAILEPKDQGIEESYVVVVVE